MKYLICFCFLACFTGCFFQSAEEKAIEELKAMIKLREQAMINKDIPSAISQFDEEASWINSQGYYFKGKEAVNKFHEVLIGNDSLDYYYAAGEPLIKLTDENHALAYYGWKMYWFRRSNRADTVNREIGLMTLSAQKKAERWKWIAVTNQHTPRFYEEIKPVPLAH